MKNLVTKRYKHMLWKDELYNLAKSTKHTFLLLKYAEVYRFSRNTLRLHIWNKKMLLPVRNLKPILNEMDTDDPFTIIDVESRIFPQIIQLGAFKRRPNLDGRWLKDKERILAHRILPYRGKCKGE
ncbi:MAG: hypothetical protein K9L87_04670 [Candidatus Omnitrophica bacterium]|nr:hypothetical protein [Candidatus Omnitrophota bacterium]